MFLLAQTSHGFLSTRAPVLALSIRLVKRRHYQWHKRIQITLAFVLLVAVTAFEIDLNFITKDWRPLAEPSPYYGNGWVDYSLWIHLTFAVPTPLLWTFVIIQALRKFPTPAAPSEYSRRHARWAWLAAIGMSLTAVTGWVFYYLAFVA
jgi:uncharacterized membrane protein YozB (DUF420 family)